MKVYTLQGCPNLAHHKLSRSTKDIPSPGKTRSVSESRFTRHFDNGKTRPAKPPDVPTNPDRSRTYLVLRAHRIGQATSKTSPQVSPRWPRSLLSSDQHLDKHWSGGAKIKMTLGLADPRVTPRWPRRLPISDQHLAKPWPGGVKIKMTLESAEPKGKRLR